MTTAGECTCTRQGRSEVDSDLVCRICSITQVIFRPCRRGCHDTWPLFFPSLFFTAFTAPLFCSTPHLLFFVTPPLSSLTIYLFLLKTMNKKRPNSAFLTLSWIGRTRKSDAAFKKRASCISIALFDYLIRSV